MKGLLLKDFINLRKNVKMFAMFLVLYGAMSYLSEDSSFYSTIITIVTAILTLSLYSYDEMVKWDTYALTLPISKEDIVQGRYLMMLLLTLIGLIVGYSFTVLFHATTGIGSLQTTMKSCSMGAAVAILYYCVAMPLITKQGIEKARIILIAVYAIPFTAAVLIFRASEKETLVISEQWMEIINYVIKNINVILLILVIFALSISYLISIWIYKRKEF